MDVRRALPAFLALALPLLAIGADTPKVPEPAKSARPASDRKAPSKKGAPNKETPKSRTLQEVIDLATRSGRDSTIPPAMSEAIGFGRRESQTKRLRYNKSVCPDGRDHYFHVVMEEDGEGETRPVAVYLTSIKSNKGESGLYVEGFAFRASLKGKLLNVRRNKGLAGDVESVELAASAPEAEAAFKYELNFHMAQVPRLGLTFEK